MHACAHADGNVLMCLLAIQLHGVHVYSILVSVPDPRWGGLGPRLRKLHNALMTPK